MFPPRAQDDQEEEAEEEEDPEAALGNRLRLLWSAWVTTYNTISAPTPSPDQKRDAGKDVRRLVWRMSNFLQPSNLCSLYLHTMLCHLEELLEENGSIGKYNQSSVETNHKSQILMWRRGGSGGVQGAKKKTQGKGKSRAEGGAAPRQDFQSGVTMDESGEHLAGQKALQKIFDGKDERWHRNHGEYKLMLGSSALNLLKGLPYCGRHNGFVCSCDLLQRQNRWQRLARQGRRLVARAKPRTDDDDDSNHDGDDRHDGDNDSNHNGHDADHTSRDDEGDNDFHHNFDDDELARASDDNLSDEIISHDGRDDDDCER